MFIVAIIPLIFSVGVNGGECESIRLAGGASTCTLALAVLGPGAPTGGEGGGVGALPLADALEDGVEEPAYVGATESEVPPRWSRSPLPPPFAASLRILCFAIRRVSVV